MKVEMSVKLGDIGTIDQSGCVDALYRRAERFASNDIFLSLINRHLN